MTTQETILVSALDTLSFLGREFKHHRSESKILTIMAKKVHELTDAPKIYAIFKHRLQNSLEVALELEDGEVKRSVESSSEILARIGQKSILEIIEAQSPLILNRQQLIDQGLFENPCKSWLGVPMSAVDRVLGVLVIQHPNQEDAFSIEVEKVLDIITDLAANAIDYYRLHQRTRLIGELESGLTELEADNEQDLLEKIYQKMQTVRDIDVLTLSISLQARYKKALKVVVADGELCDVNADSEQERLLQKLASERISTVIDSREPLLLSAGEQEGRRIESLEDTDLARWVGVPMRIHGRAIGAFVVEHPEDICVYNKDDAEFLDILSDQAANAIERVRLEQRSRALADIERNLLSQVDQESFTEEGVLEIVALRAREVCDAYNLCIFLHSEDTDNLELRFAYRRDKRVDLSNEAQRTEVLNHVPDKLVYQALHGRVRLNDRPSVIQAFGDHGQERYPASWLGVPMRISTKSIGAFVIYHMEYENVYDHNDANVLDELSDQVALALDNVRLREIEQGNFQQRIDDLEALGEIYAAVSQNSLEDVLELVLETAVNFTQADYAEFWVCDTENNTLRLQKDYKDRRSQWLSQNQFFMDRGLVGRAISLKQPCYSGNVKEENDYIEVTADVSSELIIPLVFQDQIIGSFNLESKQVNSFSSEQQELAKALGDSVAVAIANSILTEDLKNANDQLELYLKFFEDLVVTEAPFDVEVLSDFIKGSASGLMDTDNMYLVLYDSKDETIEFKMVYVRGEPQEPYPSRKLSNGRGKTEEIIKTRKSLRHTSKESKQWYSEHGEDYTRGDDDLPWLGVPVLLGQGNNERCLGVLATYSADKTYIYTEQEQAVLEKMGRWVGIALENARIAKQVAERENVLARSLIAQDLIHRLNSIAGTVPIWLQLVKIEICKFEGVDTTKAKRFIEKSLGELKNLMAQINEIEKPELEAPINLKRILDSIIEQLRVLYKQDIDANKLSIENRLEEDLHDVVGFSSLTASSLDTELRNGIDAITKKGKGALIISAMNGANNSVKITITDTGVGIPDTEKGNVFEPFFTTKESGIGYGLWRAKAVFEKMGGSINFESEVGRSTTFTILLPGITGELREA